MSTINLKARVEGGKLILEPPVDFKGPKNWFIEVIPDLANSYVLYEFPEGGGKPHEVNDFWDVDEALFEVQYLT